MPTISFIKKGCLVCHTAGRYADVGMHTIGNAQDLDGRAGDANRSSIYMIIKRCISCGYCSPDISSGPPQAVEIVTSPEYTMQLSSTDFPDTANSFFCWAIIQEKTQNFNEAGKAALYAAWVCDDSQEHRDNAALCRRKAIQYFQKAKELQQAFCKNEFDEELLIIDLYRRSGLFKEAQALCNKGLKKKCSEKQKLILYYQEDLMAQKDTRRHTLREATLT